MDIMDEVEETIKEKKSKWNYTPKRDDDETEALIDMLLSEYPKSSDDGSAEPTEHDYTPPKYDKSDETPVSAPFQAAKENYSESETDTAYEEKNYAEESSDNISETDNANENSEAIDETADNTPENKSIDNRKTVIYSRNEINNAEKLAYEKDEIADDDDYDDSGDGDSPEEPDDEAKTELFDEFMDAEDDFESNESGFYLRGFIKTILKIAVVAVIGGFCVTGIMSTLDDFLAKHNFNFGISFSSKSGDDSQNKYFGEMEKVVYGAVAADIGDFTKADELSPESVICISVIDNIVNGNISTYKNDASGKITIPELQIKGTAERIFGSDCSYKTSGAGIGDLTIRYDNSQSCYIVSGDTGEYVYTPEIADVTQPEKDEFAVIVNFKTSGDEPKTAKRKLFSIKRTDTGYMIESVKTINMPNASDPSEESETE